MRKFLFTFPAFFIVYFLSGQSPSQLDKQRIKLPNGWSLTPVGKTLQLGDLPLNIAVSSSQNLMAVTNNGQSVQMIQLIDVRREKVIDSILIPKSWYGLAFSNDNKFLFASGGHDNRILKYAIEKNKLIFKDTIILGKPWPEKIGVAGIAVDDLRKRLYVVTKENNSLYVIDLITNNILQRLPLGGEGFMCLLSPDKQSLYISCWGCDRVLLYDTRQDKFTGDIRVGDNPNEMCLSKDGKLLYVCNANDNSVSVIDLSSSTVIETLNAALYPESPSGSTTNGVALSGDGKTLYIANADNNCLAVFDVSTKAKSTSRGFIPVGWYPTNVKVIGKKIWVANGKGYSSKANPYGPNPVRLREEVLSHEGDPLKPRKVEYIGGLFQGTMSIIQEPSLNLMQVYTEAVYKNTPFTKESEMISPGEVGNPIPMKVGDKSPIKYVFYVIKENRTYDQVLGDVKGGNGDTSLVLFGERITPNQHALVKEFVLLDNFYVDAEVSMDGHNWSLGAYATDYIEKIWPSSYGGRGGSYDGEGNRAIANNKNGFIWDFCQRNGISYRTYGEFANNNKPNIPVLVGHMGPYSAGYNLAVPDTTRFSQWKRDFDSLLAVNAVPQFNSIRFSNDHTEGLRLGRPTPYAHVADNDLAVGMFVEYLSKSSIWKETAIFIIEDDAQNGADHVDAHRSTAYVAGGFVKRGFVDHTMYSTTSMLRTIELILGIPPMSQYDAAAMPMWRCFQAVPDLTPFIARPSNIDLNEKNTAINEWQRRSEEFVYEHEDANNDLEFNRVLWYGLKGSHIPFPGPSRAAFVKLAVEKIEKD